MLRRVLAALMLVLLILQGVGLAAADVLPVEQPPSMAHCAGHDDAGVECPCCGGADVMGVNCTTQCSVAVSVSSTLLTFSAEKTANAIGIDEPWVAGPSYCPLNPPPIA